MSWSPSKGSKRNYLDEVEPLIPHVAFLWQPSRGLQAAQPKTKMT